MIIKGAAIIIVLLLFSCAMIDSSICFAASQRIIERTKSIAGAVFTIKVPVYPDADEPKIRASIDKAFAAQSSLSEDKRGAGYMIDEIISALKKDDINNAFVISDHVMYCMGMKQDLELWKAWIPHPVDKKKVFAFLRLKNKAVATIRDKKSSASVVGDSAGWAEDRARGIILRGVKGIEDADLEGIDAIFIVKDGSKLKFEMAGGFKDQYVKEKK